MLKTREVAQLLGVCNRTVLNLVERGALRGLRVGKVWRFAAEDVERFKREHTS